jgi:fatty-acyl-CoA synthase
MTEMSPIGTVSFARASLDGAPAEAVRGARLKQGIFTPLVAWKLLGEDGNPVPMDGETRGELWVRGPAVTGGYFRDENAANPAFRNGYFHTGDVCTIDELGYLSLVDRSKDLVKSGGEWISSVDLENTLMGHPAIKEAAVIGIAHPKWIERPVAIVVPREDQSIVEADVKAWLAERVAKWWVPDRVIAVNSIPRTGVGKFLKRALREEYRDLFTDN